MLIAKISPSANIVSQVTPFAFEQIGSEYMTIVANQYVPDSEYTNLSILFGVMSSPVLSDNPQPSPFVLKYDYPMSLTADDLSTWGTSDRELFNIVANKFGITILEFINIP